MYQCHENDEDFAEEAANLHHAWNLSTNSCKRIFVPISDQFNRSRDDFARPGGGSHWSLLLRTISRNTREDVESTSNPTIQSSTFYHFDSSCGYNASAALVVSRKLIKVLHINSPMETAAANVHECKSPQQGNGYDCGVYLLGFAETLSSLQIDSPIDKRKKEYEETLCAKVDGAGFASQLRKRIVNVIHELI